MINMRKRITFALSMCLVLSLFSIGVASASDLGMESEKHGEINVDSIIKEHIGDVYNKAQNDTLKSQRMVTRASAGGGNFWVEWGADRHTACYDHSSKTHKSTAENGNGARISSGWVNAGITARATIKSTVSGNKAYWDVRD